MRTCARIAFALLVALAAASASGQPRFLNSPHLAAIPADPCDTELSPSMAQSTVLQQTLNDPTRRVFCVAPGNYRAAGRLVLTRSGSQAQPLVLRLTGSDGITTAVQRAAKATFEGFQLYRASWWVIHGLTVKPLDPATAAYIVVNGGDHNVIDGNLVDGIDHLNAGNASGVKIEGEDGDPAIYNTVQRNVIRNGDQSWNASDYWGVLIAAAKEPGEANDFNQVLDNEIYDWGDGVALGGYTTDCSEPEVQHGTLIDGNDIYVSENKRVDCATGALDPAGECVCAENGIDNKSNPGPNPADWTRITNNRLWGYRPTTEAVACGGSGSNGQAISCGNLCPGHTFVARNVVVDSTIGISIVGPSWVIAGNLLHEIRASNGSSIYGTTAIVPTQYASDVRIQYNTMVGVDGAYDDMSSYTDTRCNAVISDVALAGNSGARGLNHVTERNFLYDSFQPNFIGLNSFYPAIAQSGNTTFCFWRRRWTTPEQVCIPNAATEPASPHANDAEGCDPEIGAPFGIPSLSYVPEPDAAGLGLAGALTLAALARRPSRNQSSASASAQRVSSQ